MGDFKSDVTFYTSDSNEKIGTITAMSEVTEEGVLDTYSPCSCCDVMTGSFECIGKMAEAAIDAIFGITRIVLSNCHNKRIVHLATHSKNERIRKKNINRAFRMIERRINKNDQSTDGQA